MCHSLYMNIVNTLKNLLQRVRAFFPSALPQGRTEFDTWANSIVAIYAMPDNDSVRFALATMILHLPSTKSRVSKEFFGRSLQKSCSNQVAAALMQELKEKQQAEFKAQQEKAALEAQIQKQAEVTAVPAEASNGSQQ